MDSSSSAPPVKGPKKRRKKRSKKIPISQDDAPALNSVQENDVGTSPAADAKKPVSRPPTIATSGAAVSPPAPKRERSPSSARHPFQVDEADHCETPVDAYNDVVPILDFIAKSLGKKRDSLIIYDPYYCDGGVKAKLASLGFSNVINENEDFYEKIESDTIPNHDVLLTNPPYSGVHMEKLLTFGSKNRKPFLFLLPHFVYTKEYYERGLGEDMAKKVFYVVPQKRYSYVPPAWVAVDTGSTALAKGKRETAPFPSFWYCRVPSMSDAWLTKTLGASGKFDKTKRLHYAKCTAHIPREAKGEFDISKKRPNPRARKRALAGKRQRR